MASRREVSVGTGNAGCILPSAESRLPSDDHGKFFAFSQSGCVDWVQQVRLIADAENGGYACLRSPKHMCITEACCPLYSREFCVMAQSLSLILFFFLLLAIRTSLVLPWALEAIHVTDRCCLPVREFDCHETAILPTTCILVSMHKRNSHVFSFLH